MKLKNVLIVVKDIERSKKFYRDLFGLEALRNWPTRSTRSGRRSRTCWSKKSTAQV